MLLDPGLVTRIKCIVYNHGWPDVIRFAGGHVAIRREVWRRNCSILSQPALSYIEGSKGQNPAQIKANTVFECDMRVQ